MPEFVFEGLLVASLTLTGIYVLLSLYSFARLRWLQSNSTPGLNTRKLFVMTCLLVSVLRTMSFASMALLDLNSVDFKIRSAPAEDDDGNPQTKEFFNKALLVLFDFPDFCCISAYVLLLVIWAEAYLQSRRHWLSSYSFRKYWMLGYFLFNVLLYTTQTALYSLLFIPTVNQTVQMNLIYITLAVCNLLVPLVWCCVYGYLTVQFSGFPYSTPDAKARLGTLNWIGLMWSLARFGWGVVALSSVVQGWLTQAEKSRSYYTTFLIVLFVTTEVIPILFSIQRNKIQRLSEKTFEVVTSQDEVNNNVSYGPGAVLTTGSHSVKFTESHRDTFGSDGARETYSDAHAPLLSAASRDMPIVSSPNTNSFNMLYGGRASGSGRYSSGTTGRGSDPAVCIESPLTSQDFDKLYGDARQSAGTSSSLTSGGGRGSSSGLLFRDTRPPPSNYHTKESFAETVSRHDSDMSERESYVTAQTGKSPGNSNTWGSWLGFS